MKHTEESAQRVLDATQLVEDFDLQNDAEFFTDPSRRIQFLESLSPDDFFDIAQHTNARVRGFEPRDRVNALDKGGFLPMLGTPPVEEKPEAFRKGFETIQAYLSRTNDSEDQKVKGAAMAVEALVVWVHPFNDGNGRTSRFLGKFIEDGTTDTNQLIAETADKNNRLRMYDETLRVDQYNIYKDLDLMMDDDEWAELQKTDMPFSDGIAISLNRLLEDKSVQGQVEAKTAGFRASQDNFQSGIAA